MSCLLCQQAASPESLCSNCRATLPAAIKGCEVCGERLDDQGNCQDCAKHPPYFQHAISGGEYRWPADWLIQRLKFDQAFTALPPLADKLIQVLSDHYSNGQLPDTIIPMPLHSSRLHERGFNQSKMLARLIAKHFGRPLREDLIKIRATEKQSKLNAAQRQRNLKGSFAITNQLNGEYCALVDDVMTTGATANEATRALLDAGAGRVDVWLLARATSQPL